MANKVAAHHSSSRRLDLIIVLLKSAPEERSHNRPLCLPPLGFSSQILPCHRNVTIMNEFGVLLHLCGTRGGEEKLMSSDVHAAMAKRNTRGRERQRKRRKKLNK